MLYFSMEIFILILYIFCAYFYGESFLLNMVHKQLPLLLGYVYLWFQNKRLSSPCVFVQKKIVTCLLQPLKLSGGSTFQHTTFLYTSLLGAKVILL